MVDNNPACKNLEDYLSTCNLDGIEMTTRNITNDLIQQQRLEKGITILIKGEEQKATITGYPALEIIDKATLLPVLLISGTESVIDVLSQYGVQKKPAPAKE